ncbi:YchJ family protein [Planctobacterium marinum]|uniref:Preprotein translocase SecA n=1 Tax=Planctobacterium marinum TaxID=1631968 RepID=A0AA48HH14_9ALTE|nr:preprotein translocase SecA [Planctobacterium marinum]
MQTCYCCSGRPFDTCCKPLLNGVEHAINAEQLMRSRYSAYKLSKFDYILDTYGEAQKSQLSIEQLRDSAQDTIWIGLDVVGFKPVSESQAYVEFKAFYKDNNQFFQMHEISEFEYQQGFWKYTTGQMQEDSGKIKLSRNAPCPCQSGKKFKQCCLSAVG